MSTPEHATAEHVTAEQLRRRFRAAPACAADVSAALQQGRRQLRNRRWRRGLGVGLPASLAVGLVAVLPSTHSSPYELVGSGLTLAASTPSGSGPVQVSDDRVDLGDGIQAWREGSVLNIGYPQRPNAFLDTSDITAQWGDLGYDVIVFDDPGQDDGSTVVVGSVKGEPTSVQVTLNGITEQATVACFEQAPGWCSYKATMPTSIKTYETADAPVVVVR